MRKHFLCGVFTVFFIFTSVAQNSILTASSFFRSVSDTYAEISDYEAQLVIDADGTKMKGIVSFKMPNLLRIDFSDPSTQVICFNGDLLTIYLPGTHATLQQSVQSDSGANEGVNLATPNGLGLMKRYYSIAYEVGQDPVPLDEDSDEKVVKLILARRTASEGFRIIHLAVDPTTKLIRRVSAITPQNKRFEFDFSDYALNQNIPDTRFLYDSPPSANNYNNFLYSE